MHRLKVVSQLSLGQEIKSGDAIQDSQILLPALHSVAIPALCMAIIPHGLELELDKYEYSWVMLIRQPGIMTNRGLWIDQGPVLSGPVTTTVFNMTNVELRIHKGEVVSALMRVLGSRWI